MMSCYRCDAETVGNFPMGSILTMEVFQRDGETLRPGVVFARARASRISVRLCATCTKILIGAINDDLRTIASEE